MDQFVSTTADVPVIQRDVSTRATFITRTYGHLFAAMAAFTGIEVFLYQSGLMAKIAGVMLGGSWLLVLGGFMLVSWGGTHVAHSARSLGVQYAALIGGVLAWSLVFAPLLYLAAAHAPEGTIQSAAFVTLGAFAGLTAVVWYTRKDFSFLRPFLKFAGIVALVAIVASLLLGFGLGAWFSGAMILFAGAAILWDTSKILHHYPEDRYVGAALELFGSVALMFWYVLQLFMRRN